MVLDSIAGEIGINLASTLVGGGLTLTWQRSKRRFKNARAAEFLGMNNARLCSITLDVTPRGGPSQVPGKKLMTHNDAKAAMSIYGMLDRLGGRVDLFEPDSQIPDVQVEFCLGGSRANGRTGRLLEQYVPSVSMQDKFGFSGEEAKEYPQDVVLDRGKVRLEAGRQDCEYAVIARICRRNTRQGNIFIIAGQTSDGNLPAVQYLERNIEKLRKEFKDQSFCFVIKLTDWDHNNLRYETVEEFPRRAV